MISSRAASGRPNSGSVAATTTSEARDTPAMPLLLIISTSSMESWVANDISMPYTWAMNSSANAW
ncbi:hypothetical protein D3C71_2048460 [compost metagenome]